MSQDKNDLPAEIVKDQKLDPKDLLIAEFEYIANYAFQANEDRARVSSYYFVTAGAAVAAILGANLQNGTVWIYLGLALLFAVLSFVGYCTVLQLARLRAAWRDSADAMNRVIECYLDKVGDSKVEDALVWFKRGQKTPSQARVESMAFLLALSVIGAGSATMIAALIYVGQSLLIILEDQFLFVPWWGIVLWLFGSVLSAILYARFQIHEYVEWVQKPSGSGTPSRLERVLNQLRLLSPMTTSVHAEQNKTA